ncbi:hypothetical protein KGD82_16140 [Nocardiopsis eucommiae]|uniref:Uncharacterized protein n=1 Tax=Nocardiopsis eucommiae TaxID=2831970 RepID=A0A975L6Y6_9ACTN|nr:hypothetical protein KGD82_16140 [Nocardiopsis eucommiae]
MTENSSHTSVWDTLNRARGVRLTRDEYRAEIATLRSDPTVIGDERRIDPLTTQIQNDPARDTWYAGDHRTARAMLAQESEKLADPNIRRLVIAPWSCAPTPCSPWRPWRRSRRLARRCE